MIYTNYTLVIICGSLCYLRKNCTNRINHINIYSKALYSKQNCQQILSNKIFLSCQNRCSCRYSKTDSNVIKSVPDVVLSARNKCMMRQSYDDRILLFYHHRRLIRASVLHNYSAMRFCVPDLKSLKSQVPVHIVLE